MKRIVLTAAGQKARDQIEDQLLATMAPLGALDADQRRQLRDLLAAATMQVAAGASTS